MSFVPDDVQDAVASLEAALSIIQNYVDDTAAASAPAFDACPSDLVLFSNAHANSLRETVITFKRILANAVRKCSSVYEALNDDGVRIAVASGLASNNTAAVAAAAGETPSDDASAFSASAKDPLSKDDKAASSLTTAGPNLRPQQLQRQLREELNIAGQIQQATIRASPEALEAAESRLLGQVMRQLAETDTTVETFYEMARAAKAIEDVRHGQDLAVIYQRRAQELQTQLGGGGGGKSAAGAGTSSSAPSLDFLEFDWMMPTRDPAAVDSFKVGGGGGGGGRAPSPPTVASHSKVVNQLGRLTARMKEKWEMAVADCSLAEANTVALEAENALLARRVRDLEERLSLSSASAAERKVQLEREKSRSARLMQQNSSLIRRPPSAVSSISVEDDGSVVSGSSRHATPTGIARASSGGAAGGRGGGGGGGRRTPSPMSSPTTNPNTAATAASSKAQQRGSGVSIDGVELGYEFAIWMSKVHRLLLADPNATAALLALENTNTAAAAAADREQTEQHPQQQQRPPRAGSGNSPIRGAGSAAGVIVAGHRQGVLKASSFTGGTASSAGTSDSGETPFGRYMKSRERQRM